MTHPETDEYAGDIARFVTELKAGGYLTDPTWQAAFHRVPRHVFLPRFFAPLPDGRWRPIDRRSGDYGTQVYSDITLATQLDGSVEPNPTTGPVAGSSTSSSTQPRLMAVMLHALQVTGGERVLEIGTGTGYNAALLSHRLGADNVTTVEIDPTVTEHARTALAVLGYHPTVTTGDGEQGWPDAAPYDRLIATCAVPRVPRRWVDQVNDGGTIVVSLWRGLGGGPLLRLAVHDSVAHGHFLPAPGAFIPVRSVAKANAALSTAVSQTGATRRTATVPSTVLHHPHLGLWVALQVPDATWLGFTPADGPEQVWLFAADGSWAMVEDKTMRVEQYGPRSLWDEVEAVSERWTSAGNPARQRLGLTISESGHHRYWLDTPDGIGWDEDSPAHP